MYVCQVVVEYIVGGKVVVVVGDFDDECIFGYVCFDMGVVGFGVMQYVGEGFLDYVIECEGQWFVDCIQIGIDCGC